jgi:predicted O-linked N-acetylglucosamine transferase (SPINDLY family)
MSINELEEQAALALEQGIYLQAIRLYEQCIEAEPASRLYHWYLGLALLMRDQREEAQATWFAVIAEAAPEELDRWTTELVDVLIATCNRLLHSEKWQLAETLCRAVLDLVPDHLIALQRLGLSLAQQGQIEEAITLLQLALELQPEATETLKNLGIALAQRSQFEAAIAHFHQALALNAQDHAQAADTYRHLGMAWEDQGNLETAIACYQKALKLQPGFAAAYNNLGIALKLQGNLPDAIACYQKALDLDPTFYKAIHNLVLALKEGQSQDLLTSVEQVLYLDAGQPELHYNLGNALKAQGDLMGAVACYQKALAIDLGFYKALYSLGIVLYEQGQIHDAIASLEKAIHLQPDLPDPYNQLGIVLSSQYQLQQAAVALQTALALKPSFIEAYNNLGLVLQKQGLISDAIECYRKALDIQPDFQIARSNLLLAMQYRSEVTLADIFTEAQQWGMAVHQSPVTYSNIRDIERRLRIGYVSPDFRVHSVAYFAEPILAHHDRSAFEVFCYAQVSKPDSTTKRLQSIAEHWRSTVGMSDAQLIEQIQSDQIDILIDLAGHMMGNRLSAFTYKPAPVQITYLGYPSTTGLSQINYRLTDAWSDPISHGNFGYSEELIRLPQCFLCYQAPQNASNVGSLPALKSGRVTFGSFNNLAKITADAIALWSQILRALPTAQLFLKNRSFNDALTQHRYLQLFAEHGIERDRLQFVGYVPAQEHFSSYNHVDISLDTFPYNGTTTTCEALWMGVPVITLAGSNHVGRVGVSLLSAIGLEDWIEDTPETYVVTAIELASDMNRLSHLRATLRSRMAASILCNGSEFVAGLEDIYRQLWQRWCHPQASMKSLKQHGYSSS